MKEKIIEVKLSDLKYGIYVREHLDENRILFFASLMEAGADLPPIKITKDNKIIDGRHRTEAAKFLDKVKIKAVVTENGNNLQIIREAIASNWGGSLPPTKMDLIHSIMQLMEASYPANKIEQEFKNIIPLSMLRTIIQHARLKINNQRILKAKRILSDNPKMSVEKVAELVELKTKILQDSIAKDSGKREVNFVASQKDSLSARYKHFNCSIANIIRFIFKNHSDAEIDSGQVDRILEHLGGLIANQNRIWADIERRWQARKK